MNAPPRWAGLSGEVQAAIYKRAVIACLAFVILGLILSGWAVDQRRRVSASSRASARHQSIGACCPPAQVAEQLELRRVAPSCPAIPCLESLYAPNPHARPVADDGGGQALEMAGQGRVIPSSPGDVLAEIETDKATMEVEAVDEGVIREILVAEGTEGVKVNTPDRAAFSPKVKAHGATRVKRKQRPPADAKIRSTAAEKRQ